MHSSVFLTHMFAIRFSVRNTRIHALLRNLKLVGVWGLAVDGQQPELTSIMRLHIRSRLTDAKRVTCSIKNCISIAWLKHRQRSERSRLLLSAKSQCLMMIWMMMVIGKKTTTICWYPMITWFQLVVLLDSCTKRTVGDQEMRQIGLQKYDNICSALR